MSTFARTVSQRTRKPAWRRYRYDAPADTEGPALLAALARLIARNAPAALRQRVVVQQSAVQRDGYRDAFDDRAWHGERGGRDFWCIIDASSQRALLEFVLAGPGAPTSTTVERSIVAETMNRFFEDDISALRGPMSEERTRRPPAHDLWRCNVDLIDHVNKSATLQLLTAVVAPVPPKSPVPAALDVGRIPIPIAGALEPLSVRVGEMMRWQPGSLIDIEGGAAGFHVNVVAGATVLAQGALGTIGSRRAIRITVATLNGP